MSYFDLMKSYCQKINIEFNKDMYEKFIIYMEELVIYNKNFNLTSIEDKDDIIKRHFLDSITIFNYNIKNNSYLCDVGSGAGFPGIPIKILRDDIKVDLIEATNKKVKFLNHIIDKLELKNINVICDRAENVSRETFNREKYDYVTSRAMARLCVLLELVFAMLKVDGEFIGLKGIKLDNELEEAKKIIKDIGAQIEKKIEIKDFNSNLIIIKKTTKTIDKYPRNYSTIIKQIRKSL